jgi:two-component system chemotaxis sensor kinase CheA
VGDTTRTSMERVQGGGHNQADALLYRLRDTLLPLIALRDTLQLERDPSADGENIVVCQIGNTRFGLIVDDVFDTQEIVVKPVGRRVKSIGCYAGCTILGDGRVIMILDPAGVGAIAGMRTNSAPARVTDSAPSTADADTELLLLFDDGTGAQRAVPLARVARLEDVLMERIERADGRSLLQYRGALLPIVPLGPTAIETAAPVEPADATQPVIVFDDGVTSLGLAVHAIRDIVEDRVALEMTPGRPGVLGTAVIAGRATEVVDIEYYLTHSRNGGASNGARGGAARTATSRTDIPSHRGVA